MHEHWRGLLEVVWIRKGERTDPLGHSFSREGEVVIQEGSWPFQAHVSPLGRRSHLQGWVSLNLDYSLVFMLISGEPRLLTVDQHVQTPVTRVSSFRTSEDPRPAHMPALDWSSLQADHSRA